jgi:DNA-binding MarR family transcriptional regulator
MTKPDPVEMGNDLREVFALLLRRFREPGTLPTAQTSVLARLVRSGPMTTSRLAALERVRPQSMAHTVAELATVGHVQRSPDPADRRQVLIAATPHGRDTMDALRRDGVAWVSGAIGTQLDQVEQAALADAIVLLRRLADAP